MRSGESTHWWGDVVAATASLDQMLFYQYNEPSFKSVRLSQLADAAEVLVAAGDEGAAAADAARVELAGGKGLGSDLLATAHAAMSDDLSTPQTRTHNDRSSLNMPTNM